MKTDQIIMCVVLLLLGMLLFNMLQNVCGCKNVSEGLGSISLDELKSEASKAASTAEEKEGKVEEAAEAAKEPTQCDPNNNSCNKGEDCKEWCYVSPPNDPPTDDTSYPSELWGEMPLDKDLYMGITCPHPTLTRHYCETAE